MKLEKDPHLLRWLETLDFQKGLFQWDAGNATKNLKHGVTQSEVMEIFRTDFVLGGKIVEPFHPESRWVLFGQTSKARFLTLVFTIRDELVRPISCRPMRKEEKKLYEEICGQTT